MPPKRERCVLCHRERATQVDWDRNAELDDEQAAKAGLDDLCWEQGENDCLGFVAEAGRPNDYLAAMTALDSLLTALQGEVKLLLGDAVDHRTAAAHFRAEPVKVKRADQQALQAEAAAKRLQAILDTYEGGDR